jgi:hypothetical protein
MEQESVHKCDRCLNIFDTNKIKQGTYGTRHCLSCVQDLRNYSDGIRIQWIYLPEYDITMGVVNYPQI